MEKKSTRKTNPAKPSKLAVRKSINNVVIGKGYTVLDGNLRHTTITDLDASLCQLRRMDLSHAQFNRVKLDNGSINECNLMHASFFNCSLKSADLEDCIYTRISMYNCDLTGAQYKVSNLLHNIKWRTISKELVIELINRDAVLVGKKAMQDWIKEETCPFSFSIVRDFEFDERAVLYTKVTKPKLNDLELFRALCAEHKIKISI